MRLLVSKHNLGVWSAYYLYKKISEFQPTTSKPFVIAVSRGGLLLEMYNQLIKLHQANLLDFENVILFSTAEYAGLENSNPKSYYAYLQSNFIRHINIKPDNVFLLNGMVKDLGQECLDYERKILEVGGINLLFEEVTEEGSLAFNEPFSSLTSVTRVKTLNHNTVLSNSQFFDYNMEKTPKTALTIGLQTIMNVKQTILLAKGLNKSEIINKVIEGAVCGMVPVSVLQTHPKTAVVCDELAAYELKLKTIKYFENMHDEYAILENELMRKI